MELVCKNCHNTFAAPTARRIFCCKGCATSHRNKTKASKPKLKKKSCVGCGVIFTCKSRKAKWCSSRCRSHQNRKPGYRKAYYLKNKARESSRFKRYYRRNREHLVVVSALRVQKRRGAPGSGVTPRQWKDRLQAFGGRCVYCQRRRKLQVDHVIPIGRGGRHEIQNVVPACRSCNSSKKDRLLHEWRGAK